MTLPDSELTLIPLTVPLIGVAAALHADAFGAEAWSDRAIGELLGMPGAQGRIAVAQGADPVGFALWLLVADTAELLTLAVPPPFRRRGIARSLVANFFECAKEFSATNAFLEVAEDNISAISLYNSLGFRFQARRPDYYDRGANNRVAAHVLRCTLVQI